MPKSSTINYGEASKRITAWQRAARLITACQRAARLIMGRLQSASQHAKEQHNYGDWYYHTGQPFLPKVGSRSNSCPVALRMELITLCVLASV